MQEEYQKSLSHIKDTIDIVRRSLDWDKLNQRLQALNHKIDNENLWDKPEQAQEVMRERAQIDQDIKKCLAFECEYKDAVTLAELADEEDDPEAKQEAQRIITDLYGRSEAYRLESLLSGEADRNDCFLEIHAGAGGTEAQDWAQMLMRMYTMWAGDRGYSLEQIEESLGEEAGIKSSTLKIMGARAYGWLKSESGVHRLVRISPFDSNARRHTSFASVYVYPVIDDNIEVVVEEKDLKIDTYRASGAGGQHINKTESAVRITHMPTGIIVQCQTDRSQHKNKATAISMLRARIYEMELRKREEQQKGINSAKSDIGWGHQIRSYVLHPYQMVKDLRTNYEKGNAQAVLDGKIDEFLLSYLGGMEA
ncbi:MAG: peptide chain release factor 2 [Holosporales bacterium]|nr:peptide chain release factor 2 [Holosporales bacterium]